MVRTAAHRLDWRFRRALWNRWHVLRYRKATERPILPPRPGGRKLGLLPFGLVDRDLPLHNVRVFDSLPDEENDRRMRAATAISLWLQRRIPPHIAGLPEVDADPQRALDHAYTSRHRQQFPVPERPSAFTSAGPDLGELALRGPYSILVERGDTGALCWDLRRLSDFEHHAELVPLGVLVRYAEAGDGTLEATEIVSDAFGTIRAGDAEWKQACRLAVCAATTHLSLTRHFNYVHLVAANHWDVVTRNELPVDHPLYRLLWPHLTQGLYTNHGITRSQLAPHGDFVNIFSFTHAGLMAYFDATYADYDISVTDPDRDWNRRGLVGTTIDCETHRNLSDLFGLMNDHATRYLMTHYPSDQAVADDAVVGRWLAALDQYVPNGIYAVLGEPVTRGGLARLIAAFMYEGNTIHDLVGTFLWDYQLWPDANPTRMYRDGRRVPVDVYLRTVNNNFGLQLRRAKLLDDYGEHALTEHGAALFTRFRDECAALQARYDRTPAGPWRLEPQHLEISMNG